jgi:cell division protease FtsH
LIFKEVSTGASNDRERIAQLARNMIVVYGMSEKLPNISLVNKSNPGFLGQASELEQGRNMWRCRLIWKRSQIINQCYEDAKSFFPKR